MGLVNYDGDQIGKRKISMTEGAGKAANEDGIRLEPHLVLQGWAGSSWPDILMDAAADSSTIGF